jgi:putative membrane protein
LKTVVLCIDRDNDVGEKAGIKGPIIGRKDNLAAAMKLALADPEDTDVNTMFAAVRLFDQMKFEGRDVEVVTVLGDKSLGLPAGERISSQLDVIVQVLKADSAVIVTDGAEDEYVLPLIQSRLKLINVERVIVKSLPTGKETVSILRKYMQEERFKIGIIFPVALGLLMYALFAWASLDRYYLIGVTLALGSYLVLVSFNVGEMVYSGARTIRVGVATSRLSLGGSALAGVILLVGGVLAVQYILTGIWPFGEPAAPPTDIGAMVVTFALVYAPVMYSALMVRLVFRLLDFRIRRHKPTGGVALRFVGTTAYFLIALGALHAIAALLGLAAGLGPTAAVALIIAGVVAMLGGAVVGRRFKDRLGVDAEETGA